VLYSSDEEDGAGDSNSQAEVSGEDSSDELESELESEPESDGDGLSVVENDSDEEIGTMGENTQEKKAASQKRKSQHEQQQKKKHRKETNEEEEEEVTRRNPEEVNYEVGQFVTAVYENQWLVAQVDINQDKAGDKHVNLSYMERIGENQFRWPRHHDLLLTLKEDILTKCSVPCLVGNSIRALHVGLSAADALAADVALAAVAYLQLILFQIVFLNLFLFPFLFVPLLRQRGINRVWL
jgi:hypothetical protein